MATYSVPFFIRPFQSYSHFTFSRFSVSFDFKCIILSLPCGLDCLHIGSPELNSFFLLQCTIEPRFSCVCYFRSIRSSNEECFALLSDLFCPLARTSLSIQSVPSKWPLLYPLFLYYVYSCSCELQNKVLDVGHLQQWFCHFLISFLPIHRLGDDVLWFDIWSSHLRGFGAMSFGCLG